MTQSYDVVVVGARCAGAAFATFMARGGARVLLVDKAALPSDLVLSTHAIHPSGMQVVRELGFASELSRVTPEMTSMRIDWCGGILDLRFEPGHGELCPRRLRFDQLLQTAALSTSVELRARTKATGLELEHGRVVGVHLQGPSGESQLVRAALVVGADGRDSKIAAWVGAAAYYEYEAPRGIYWNYWPAPKDWGRSEQYPGAMYTYRCDNRIGVAFHTDDDQVLLGVLPLKRELAAFRSAPLVQLRAALAQHPMLGPIAAFEPSTTTRGYVGDRYFFRQPVGPGWLLLGDAGLHKDFLSGDGMSEALLQARSAAAVLLGAVDDERTQLALNEWALRRDLEALPYYIHTKGLAQADTYGGLNRIVLKKVNADPALRRAFAATFARQTTPQGVVSGLKVGAWAVAATLGGDFAIGREFLRQAKDTAMLGRELGTIRRKLSIAERSNVGRVFAPGPQLLQRSG